jgi:hypothetical protein
VICDLYLHPPPGAAVLCMDEKPMQPIHASWMNRVECGFSILQRRVIRYGSLSSQQALR